MGANASIDLDRLIFVEDIPPAAAPFPLIRNTGRNLVSRVSRVARTLRRAADSASDAMKERGQAEADRIEKADQAAGRALGVVARAGELLSRLERAAELIAMRPASIKTTDGSAALRTRCAEDLRAIVDQAERSLGETLDANLPSNDLPDADAALRDLIAPRLGVLRIRTGNAVNTISRDAQAAHDSAKEILAECDALAIGAQAALSTARASCMVASASVEPIVASPEFACAERLAAEVLTRHAACLDIVSSAIRAARRLENSHARLMAALASADEVAITTPAAALRAISTRDATSR